MKMPSGAVSRTSRNVFSLFRMLRLAWMTHVTECCNQRFMAQCGSCATRRRRRPLVQFLEQPHDLEEHRNPYLQVLQFALEQCLQPGAEHSLRGPVRQELLDIGQLLA